MSSQISWDLGSSGDLDYKLYRVIYCVLLVFFFLNVRFKTNHHLLQLFRRLLQPCFAVNVQECFVDLETSPDFPSALW